MLVEVPDIAMLSVTVMPEFFMLEAVAAVPVMVIGVGG